MKGEWFGSLNRLLWTMTSAACTVAPKLEKHPQVVGASPAKSVTRLGTKKSSNKEIMQERAKSGRKGIMSIMPSWVGKGHTKQPTFSAMPGITCPKCIIDWNTIWTSETCRGGTLMHRCFGHLVGGGTIKSSCNKGFKNHLLGFSLNFAYRAYHLPFCLNLTSNVWIEVPQVWIDPLRCILFILGYKREKKKIVQGR